MGGFIGARTGSPAAGGGQYGLFYAGSDPGAAASSEAWIYGLQQNAAVRSNLAIVNLGASGGTSSYHYELYDGTTGLPAGTSDTLFLPPGGWTQITRVLEAAGIANGYASVVKSGGADPFLAYGVVNDNATNDGSFVAAQNQ